MRGSDLVKIRNKLRPKVVNEIIELRDSREDVLKVLVNFLENIGLRYDFIHTLISDHNSKEKKNIQTIHMATGLYLSSLVTCWETFFRDIFVFVFEIDDQVKEKVIKFLVDKDVQIEKFESEGISPGEFMCKQFNFQDLDDTRNAFNFLFNEEKNSITEYMTGIVSGNLAFSSHNFILFWLQQQDDVPKRINEVLTRTFNIRHRVIHDANFEFEIDVEFMTKVEDCFIILPQLISIWLARRYNQKLSVIDLENKHLRLTQELSNTEAPYIFSREDFVAQYVIVE
jgi:hypothetical protein